MELTVYFRMLDQSTAQMLLLTGQMPEGRLSTGPEGGWAIGQTLLHICLAERWVCDLVARPSGRTAETEELFGPAVLRKRLLEERHHKVPAPAALEPGKGFDSVGAFERQCVSRRGWLKRHLQDGTIAVDRRIHHHPLLGDMTISDWLYFLICHTCRHRAQIQDLLERATSAAG